MSVLLRRLLSFLFLGVEPEGTDDSQPPADAAPDVDPAPATTDDSLDDLIDAGDTAPEPDDPKIKLTAAEKRAEEAERQLAAERSARSTPAPSATHRDPEFEREEQQIAEAQARGVSESDLGWLRWQIESNRRIRNSERSARDALYEARELADKADFDRLEVTKPKTYKAYKDRIEKMVAETRAKGQPVPPRAAILRLLIGDDIMNGKIKPKTAKAAATTGEPVSRVERARLPTHRSDVSGRSQGSERQKRFERLKDQLI